MYTYNSTQEFFFNSFCLPQVLEGNIDITVSALLFVFLDRCLAPAERVLVDLRLYKMIIYLNQLTLPWRSKGSNVACLLSRQNNLFLMDGPLSGEGVKGRPPRKYLFCGFP